MPAQKKHPSTRARRNKTSTAATLKPKLGVVADAEYDGMTVSALKAEIDNRNAGRPDEAKLSKRGNKAALVAALTRDDDPTPELPARVQGWHEMTRKWWVDIWASPMSSEWDPSDDHNLYVLAALYDDIWTAETAKERKDAMGEYRLQRADLGLSPYSRRRLEWTIESAEDAKERGKTRRSNGSSGGQQGKGSTRKGGRPDPRAQLHSVS